ncbi:uncharacterized protein Z518_09211 [Rhinocladiella mackenziei CBS 650.93]|uniref:RRM domain-containing protein n=1 Tax=Rhinocladiella mackenziei CBS 650.93 TaxID=1442369 RepID=A0A0D2IY54_9EURO|nr:uncharacterized protein Z518_09211 [Rhinocladiella mackenziei CBS 650.93]KIX01485.1 hypothetical protein Z518_09211 [Rhinocladiella mackenziei CBS 650.93]
MSDPKTAVDFDAIIQADRQRKKNEALANEIFGRNKQNKNNSRSASKSSTRTPDLASRITKQSSSAASTGASRNNSFTPPSRSSSTNPQNARSSRLASALESPQANIITPQRRATGPGLSIKGKAGPFVVEASNFAPGTTAADIESALQSEILDDNGVSGMLSCRLVSTHPTVIAEMVFAERYIADKIISTYDNQRADGRILHLRFKRSGGGSGGDGAPTGSQSGKAEETSVSVRHPPSADDGAMEDIETEQEAYDDPDRRGREIRQAEPDIQDGRYGFSGLQSSEAHNGQANSSRREDDRQERDRDRDRDRERDRYDRRDDRGPGSGPSSYRRDERTDSYNSRPSHYGNGVGGDPARGSFGGPGSFTRGGGGRMYSDDMMRGTRRSGFGSGYRRGY